MKLSEVLYKFYDIYDPIKHDIKGLIKGWAIKAAQLEAENEALHLFAIDVLNADPTWQKHYDALLTGEQDETE